MEKIGKAAETEKRIREMLSQRLQKLGPVSNYDAWVLCRSSFSYSTINNVFRKVMNEMLIDGKAEQLKRGQWWIRKNKFTI